MKILVEDFTQASIEESFNDYGMYGVCVYNEGDSKGTFNMDNGSYEFFCHFDSSEIELTELKIGISDLIDNSSN